MLDKLIERSETLRAEEASGNAFRAKAAREKFDQEMAAIRGKRVSWEMPVNTISGKECSLATISRELPIQYGNFGSWRGKLRTISLAVSPDVKVPFRFVGEERWLRTAKKDDPALVTGTVESIEAAGGQSGDWSEDRTIMLSFQTWVVRLKGGTISNPSSR